MLLPPNLVHFWLQRQNARLSPPTYSFPRFPMTLLGMLCRFLYVQQRSEVGGEEGKNVVTLRHPSGGFFARAIGLPLVHILTMKTPRWS